MIRLIAWLKKIHVFHTWTQWETVDAGSLVRTDDMAVERVIGHFTNQRRKCEVCGYTQLSTEVARR